MSSLRYWCVPTADETTGAWMARTPKSVNPARADPPGEPEGRAESATPWPPRGRGLYDPRYEHDACGVGLVADLSGRRAHSTVAQALTVLRNLDHRGAKGSDPETGDGAGILTQLPDEFFRAVCDFPLPPLGHYAAGLVFLSDDESADDHVRRIEQIAV